MLWPTILTRRFSLHVKNFTQLKQHYLEYKITSCVLWIKIRRSYYFYYLFYFAASFDTVDHAILISRLSNRFGIKGTALAWFKTYLTSHQQFDKVEKGMSSKRPLLRGVPQGSVLGPLLYLVYTAPIADIFKKHDLLYHLYANDITRLTQWRSFASL